MSPSIFHKNGLSYTVRYLFFFKWKLHARLRNPWLLCKFANINGQLSQDKRFNQYLRTKLASVGGMGREQSLIIKTECSRLHAKAKRLPAAWWEEYFHRRFPECCMRWWGLSTNAHPVAFRTRAKAHETLNVSEEHSVFFFEKLLKSSASWDGW